MLPWAMPVEHPMIGDWAMLVSVLMGLMMSYYAIKLYRTCEVKDAKKLMFASFVYLPVVQIVYVINQL